MMARRILAIAAVIGVNCMAWTLVITDAAAADSDAAPEATAWHTTYSGAMETAEREQKPLVLIFHEPADRGLVQSINSAVNSDSELRYRLGQVVLAQLPLDSQITIQGRLTRIVAHPAYAGLQNGSGVAVVDYRSPATPQFGRVVCATPLAAENARLRDRLAEACVNVTTPEPISRQASSIAWYSDYAEATEQARAASKMLLIYFYDPAKQESYRHFDDQTLADPNLVARLQNFVLVKLSISTCVASDGQPVRLIGHQAFREMHCQPGIAIIDYAHRDTEFYEQVVSTFPFLNQRAYSAYEMAIILDLPPGTLTQRTMIYAVRTHPERPASTIGRLDPELAEEAERHSHHQARIRVQGHHNWQSRFHQINAKLPPGLLASEVCAESWPGEGLLQAAIECVRCWRTSSGHWSRVHAPQRAFGYDIKRGGNGIWYATGIFGGNR